MRSRLTIFIMLAVCLVFALLFARQMYLTKDLPRDKMVIKKIRILTYSTFVGSNGPGNDIIRNFKKAKGVDVEVVTAGDAGLLLERLKLAQNSSPFDVVIGLDQISIVQAREQFQWKPLTPPAANLRAEAKLFGIDPFEPFDWSPMTFIYRSGEEPPAKFEDLTLPRFQGMFALQDPRASSPGAQFYNWVKAVEGDKTAQFLAKFKANVQSVSPSWSFSYGIFKKKQAHYVFSYLTSLAFHWGLEKDRSYQAVSFPEGHPVQVEFAAVPSTCTECDLAREFVVSLLDPISQKLIMEKNFMLPVLAGVENGTIFQELPPLKVRQSNPLAKDLNDWDQVFKR